MQKQNKTVYKYLPIAGGTETPSFTIRNYRHGILHFQYTGNHKYYSMPFDVANIVDEGIAMQAYVNDNCYVTTFKISKSDNTITVSGTLNVEAMFATFYE